MAKKNKKAQAITHEELAKIEGGISLITPAVQSAREESPPSSADSQPDETDLQFIERNIGLKS